MWVLKRGTPKSSKLLVSFESGTTDFLGYPNFVKHPCGKANKKPFFSIGFWTPPQTARLGQWSVVKNFRLNGLPPKGREIRNKNIEGRGTVFHTCTLEGFTKPIS
jgi:hypothetical protein